MKIILLKDVPKIGKRYDIKEVNDGYAVNFLMPRKLAEPATPKSIASLEKRKKEIKIEREIREDLLLKNLEDLKGKTILIKGKANEKGHLFSSIHKKELLDALMSQHHAGISKEFIMLDKPLKEIGEFEIPVEIKGKKSSFKAIIEKI